MNRTSPLRRAAAAAAVLTLAIGALGMAEERGVSTNQVVVVKEQASVRTLPDGFFGMNANYIMDGGWVLQNARPLAAALKEMGVGLVRYPGGEKSDGVLFGAPPYAKAIPHLIPGSPWPRRDSRWVDEAGAFRFEPLNFEQAAAMSRAAGAGMMLVLPYDIAYGSASERPSVDDLMEHAAAWVRFAKAGGVEVEGWELGNESYMAMSYHGEVKAEQYAKDLVRFGERMRREDSSVRLLACGPDQGEGKAAGEEEPWWKLVLDEAGGELAGLSLHVYPCWKWMRYETYREKRPDVAGPIRSIEAAVERWARPEDAKRLKFWVTELNSADWFGHPEQKGWTHRASLGHALVLADCLGQLALEARVAGAVVWNTRWSNNQTAPEIWDALGPSNELLATGMAMKAAAWALRGQILATEGPGQVVSFASRAEDEVRLLLINRSADEAEVEVVVDDEPILRFQRLLVLSGDGPDDPAPRCEVLDANVSGNVVKLAGDSLMVLGLKR